MRIHKTRIALITLITLTIICTISCVAFNDATDRKNNPNTETSVTTVETTTITTTEETKTTEAPTTESPVEEETVAPETVPTKTEKPTEVKKPNKEVTTTKPTIETTETSSSSQSEDDLYYLAAAVCREAGGSSEEVQLLVANVVINRVNSSEYPNTIHGVLTQYMQYGTMWKYGVSFPGWADQATKDQCYSVARRILNGERVCPSNVVFQAEFRQGSGVYKEIDGFYFCYR